MTKDNEELNKEIKRAFDKSIEQLPAETVSKITAIRTQSLDAKTSSFSNWLLPVTASSFASVCLAALLYFNYQSSTSNQALTIEDIELLSSSEQLDLYEDLDFYLWLEEHELSS